MVATTTKYGYMGEMLPEFKPLAEASEKDFADLWSKPLDEFIEAWRSFPPALLDDSPTTDDIDISHRMAPVSDGTEVELRLYRDKNAKPNAPLLLVAHGGGQSSKCLSA